MPRYDCNLYEHIQKFEGVDKVLEILSISKQIVNLLKVVHTSRRVHNDLKPENVMIKTLQDGSTQACLIDYGFATKYYGEGYTHIGEQETTEDFKGNFQFSSLRQM